MKKHGFSASSVLVISSLLVFASVPSNAQQMSMPLVRVGDLRRIELRDGRLVEGVVTDVDGRRFALRNRNEPPVWLDRDSVRSYQNGLPPLKGRGARRGVLIGAGIAVAISGVSLYLDSRPSDSYVKASIFVVPVSLLFPLIGAGIGASSASIRWEPVVMLTSADRAGMNVGLRLGF